MTYKDVRQPYNPYYIDKSYSDLGYDKWMISAFGIGMSIFAYIVFLTITAFYNHSRFDNWYLLGCCKIRTLRKGCCLPDNDNPICSLIFGEICMTIVYMAFLFIGMKELQDKPLDQYKQWLMIITCLESICLPLCFVSYMFTSFSHPLFHFEPIQRVVTRIPVPTSDV
jgi:hypothetical protein